MPPEHEPKTWTITFTAIPGRWQAPPIARLRALLKASLRAWGMRCIDCRPAPCQCDICQEQKRKDPTHGH
jgi:hypothetical protein